MTTIRTLITGEIGRLLSLPVPEIVFAALDPVLARAEPDRCCGKRLDTPATD
jgi:hypothetical protein